MSPAALDFLSLTALEPPAPLMTAPPTSAGSGNRNGPSFQDHLQEAGRRTHDDSPRPTSSTERRPERSAGDANDRPPEASDAPRSTSTRDDDHASSVESRGSQETDAPDRPGKKDGQDEQRDDEQAQSKADGATGAEAGTAAVVAAKGPADQTSTADQAEAKVKAEAEAALADLGADVKKAKRQAGVGKAAADATSGDAIQAALDAAEGEAIGTAKGQVAADAVKSTDTGKAQAVQVATAQDATSVAVEVQQAIAIESPVAEVPADSTDPKNTAATAAQATVASDAAEAGPSASAQAKQTATAAAAGQTQVVAKSANESAKTDDQDKSKSGDGSAKSRSSATAIPAPHQAVDPATLPNPQSIGGATTDAAAAAAIAATGPRNDATVAGSRSNSAEIPSANRTTEAGQSRTDLAASQPASHTSRSGTAGGSPSSQPGGLNSLSQTDRLRLIERVARAVQTAQDRGGELKLRLSPPELGSLKLEVQLRDGALSARIEAQTQDARQVLIDNLPALRERLSEQNIRVERFDVDLSNNGSQGGMPRNTDRQSDQAFAQSGGRGTGGDRGKSTTTDEPVAAARGNSSPVADGRLNILI